MLSGCSKGKPVESASLTTSADSYSYVIYENGAIESNKKNDYEKIQSQADFINLACATAEFVGSRINNEKASTKKSLTSITRTSAAINLLNFVNKPLTLGSDNIVISYKYKNINLSEAHERLNKVREIPYLKYQSTFHASESKGFESALNQNVSIQNGMVTCDLIYLVKKKI
jgi:hypothetical protein